MSTSMTNVPEPLFEGCEAICGGRKQWRKTVDLLQDESNVATTGLAVQADLSQVTGHRSHALHHLHQELRLIYDSPIIEINNSNYVIFYGMKWLLKKVSGLILLPHCAVNLPLICRY